MMEEAGSVTATKRVIGAGDLVTPTAAGDSVATTAKMDPVVGVGSTTKTSEGAPTVAGISVTPIATGNSVTLSAAGDSAVLTASGGPGIGAATGGGVDSSGITDARTLHMFVMYALTACRVIKGRAYTIARWANILGFFGGKKNIKFSLPLPLTKHDTC